VKFDFLGLKTLTVIQNAVDLLAARGRHRDRARSTSRSTRSRSTTGDLRALCLGQDGRGVPGGKLGHDGRAAAHEADLHRGHRGARRALPARPDGEHPEILRGQERARGARVDPPADRPHPRRDPGHHRLSGTGDADRPGNGGLQPGGADLLRRAMGKKIQEAMDAERPKFLEGAAENGVDEAKALEVWNLLDKFANYGFNKSHAAAYAVVSYQTAWLKANHPVEFMAAVMNCDIHLTDKLNVYKREVDRLGIEAGAALRQPLRRDLRGVGGPHPLCAGRAQERGRRGDAADRRGARRGGEKPFATSVRPRAPGRPQARRQAGAGDAGPRRRLRRARPNRRGCLPASTR
jgi:DNA polymerase-3 subunit alpha